jgi:hypothetical protein
LGGGPQSCAGPSTPTRSLQARQSAATDVTTGKNLHTTGAFTGFLHLMALAPRHWLTVTSGSAESDAEAKYCDVRLGACGAG